MAITLYVVVQGRQQCLSFVEKQQCWTGWHFDPTMQNDVCWQRFRCNIIVVTGKIQRRNELIKATNSQPRHNANPGYMTISTTLLAPSVEWHSHKRR
jgi:hypothetical protein